MRNAHAQMTIVLVDHGDIDARRPQAICGGKSVEAGADDDALGPALRIFPDDREAQRLLRDAKGALKAAKSANARLLSQADEAVRLGRLEEGWTRADEAVRNCLFMILGTAPGERVVFKVTEVKIPTFDPQAADAKRIDEALKARVTEDLIAQYIARLESDIGVSINQSALNQVTGGGTQN